MSRGGSRRIVLSSERLGNGIRAFTIEEFGYSDLRMVRLAGMMRYLRDLQAQIPVRSIEISAGEERRHLSLGR